jgi:hypothetical protein
MFNSAQERGRERELQATAEEILAWLENVDLENVLGDTEKT